MTCVYLANKLWWYLNVYLKPVDEVNIYRETSEAVVCELCIHTSVKWCYTQSYTDLAPLIKVHTAIYLMRPPYKEKEGRTDMGKKNDR